MVHDLDYPVTEEHDGYKVTRDFPKAILSAVCEEENQ